MTRRTATLLVAAVTLLALVVLSALAPVPYVALGPGPTFNALGEHEGKPLLTVTGAKTYPTSGSLDVTTVSETGGPYGRMSLGEAIRGWLDPQVAVVPQDLLFPPDKSSDEVQQQNEVAFSDAEDSATLAALNYLDIPHTTVPKISSVESGSAADGVLKEGDQVLAVGGKPVATVAATRAAIRAVKPGSSVSITIERDGKKQDVSVTPKPSEQDGASVPVVGVTLTEGFDSEVQVTYSLEGVGGPSAGLIFALGVVDLLTPGELNGGANVAGTGTIDPAGNVGAIGGIQQKLRGARDDGATIFLVPADNCAVALGAVPNGLTLVKVETLTGAIDALAALTKDPAASVPSC